MSETSETLAIPDVWHAPCCYWFWHSIPGSAEIDEQVERMWRAGYRSFQIQPRRAFPLEDYLSDDYFAAYGRAVEQAAEHGMIVGVYDDYNWQTGQAGGRAVGGGSPDLRERHAFWTTGSIPAAAQTGPDAATLKLEVSGIVSSTESMGAAGMSWHYDDSEVRWDGWKVVLAVSRDPGTPGAPATDVTEQTAIVSSDGSSAVVSVATAGLGPGSEITVFVAATCVTSRLINYLDADAVEAFVQAGYQPYFDHLGAHFGSTIRYFFFDQPHANFYTWDQRVGELQAAFPISSSWWAALAAEFGEELPRTMLALLDGTDPLSDELRIRFYEHHGEWSRRTFLGPLKEWTSAHDMLFSGHEVLGHVGGWALSRAFSSWDLRVNFGLDYFAIDRYRDLTGVDGESSRPQLSAKLGDSVARWNGRSGTILEQYFGSPPGTEPYSGHWGLTLEELRRATLRNHILGMRQLVFHGFYQTDGDATDPHVLSNARFDFPPGINYEPWFDDYHADFALETGRLSEFLDAAVPDRPVAVLYPLGAVLADGGGSEAAVQTGEWCERLFRAGIGYDLVPEEALDGLGARFSALVLPGAHVFVRGDSLAAIDRFVGGGGRVLVSGGSPLAEPVPGVTRTSEVPHWTELGALFAGPSDRSPRLSFTSDQLAIWRGAAESGPRIVVFNESPVEPALVRVDGPIASVRRWDLVAGTSVTTAQPPGRITVELRPNEILALDLVVATSSSAGFTETEGPTPEPAVEPATTEVVTIEENWTIRCGSSEASAVELREGWERQGLPDFAGTATYSSTFLLDESRVAGASRLVLPAVASSATVRLNGVEVGSSYYPPHDFELPASTLRAGENLLEVDVTNTAANKYYSGTIFHREPEPSGLLAAPLLKLTPIAERTDL